MTDFEIYLKTNYLILLGNMPSKLIDYTNTYFYKIVCKDTSIKDCYVGHTTDFTKRKSQHKRMTTTENDRHYNIYLYQFIRENGGWENWEMINIETRSCKDSLEAKTVEREFTEKLKANLNRVKAIETQEEKVIRKKQWAEDNAERVKENNRRNYLEHKEERNAYGKQYRKEHREEIKEWKKQHYQENKETILAKQKEDYENNKEVKLERNRVYRENNKEKVRAQANQVINCECGNKYTKQNKSRHLKSQRHQTYLNQQNEN